MQPDPTVLIPIDIAHRTECDRRKKTRVAALHQPRRDGRRQRGEERQGVLQKGGVTTSLTACWLFDSRTRTVVRRIGPIPQHQQRPRTAGLSSGWTTGSSRQEQANRAGTEGSLTSPGRPSLAQSTGTDEVSFAETRHFRRFAIGWASEGLAKVPRQSQ